MDCFISVVFPHCRTPEKMMALKIVSASLYSSSAQRCMYAIVLSFLIVPFKAYCAATMLRIAYRLICELYSITFADCLLAVLRFVYFEYCELYIRSNRQLILLHYQQDLVPQRSHLQTRRQPLPSATSRILRASKKKKGP